MKEVAEPDEPKVQTKPADFQLGRRILILSWGCLERTTFDASTHGLDGAVPKSLKLSSEKSQGNVLMRVEESGGNRLLSFSGRPYRTV